MDKMSMSYETMLGIFAEIVLDDALRAYHRQRLYQEIDEALQRGDQEAFIELTNELKAM